MSRPVRLERLLPFACIGGAVLLVASQFMTIFELNEAGGVTRELITSTDQHWYSMAVFGTFGVLVVLGALSTGSKPLATSVAVTGAAALLLFLLIDLPEANKAGNVFDQAESFVIAKADPAGGFWIELIGALVLTVCGAALATLTPDQLRSLRRSRRGESAGRKRARPWRRGEPEPRLNAGRAPSSEEAPHSYQR